MVLEQYSDSSSDIGQGTGKELSDILWRKRKRKKVILIGFLNNQVIKMEINKFGQISINNQPVS